MNLEVRRGEIFGLLGPNGAGKTTTLKIIVGLLRMDRGIVKINGIDIREEPYEYKRLIGYVPESVSLPDYLTVEELLVYSGKIRGVPMMHIKERMDYFVKIFELEDKRRTLIASLSSGMRQKVAIVSALINDPDLLILDEPFIGIDPMGQHILKEMFGERVKDGKTVFISTHMLDTAERLCDRVAVIHRGQNVASGDLKDLQRLSRTGEDATLEEVFLRLIEEAKEMSMEKPIKEERKGFSIFFRRDAP
ncbi:MAG: ABC transporter ATP-binding protein [Nitrososphaerota archaeon]|nr:ABC transporter ATP-binding protein [Candidatus Bathyarchaeota archaeon]MDW8061115.1 ABC transporter ATP-binding protein [Nitrososphaerota archaeon]